MFVQVCFLRKRYVTSHYETLVRPLFSVSPQVIKKVMPAAEYFAAAIEFTTKKPYQPMGFWVEVLQYSVILRVWDMFVNSNKT